MKSLKLLSLSATFILLVFRAGATTFYVNVSNTVPVWGQQHAVPPGS